VRDWRILVGDVLEMLATLPDASIHCCVTSPPYWGLRDYGTGTWEGGDADCEHVDAAGPINAPSLKSTLTTNSGRGPQPGDKYHCDRKAQYRSLCGNCGAARIDQQIGLEATPEEFVAKIVAVFREVRRVMRPDGTLWMNLGDSHANDGKWGGQTGGKQAYLDEASLVRNGREKRRTGLKPKDLVGIPWMVAFALRADGWYLRQDIIWAKPNPMPESVTDRCTKAHEYIFLMSKSERYYYDQDAIKERANGNAHARGGGVDPKAEMTSVAGWASGPGSHSTIDHNQNGAHPKTFEKLGREGPNSRMRQDRDPAHPSGRKPRSKQNESFSAAISGDELVEWRNKRDVWEIASYPFAEAHFATFPPDLVRPCILAGCPVGGTVLDPFSGAGTTGLVAIRHDRKYIGIELNPEYAEMSEQRLAGDAPLFNAPDEPEAPCKLQSTLLISPIS
jgi:DNA modification methylase